MRVEVGVWGAREVAEKTLITIVYGQRMSTVMRPLIRRENGEKKWRNGCKKSTEPAEPTCHTKRAVLTMFFPTVITGDIHAL